MSKIPTRRRQIPLVLFFTLSLLLLTFLSPNNHRPAPISTSSPQSSSTSPSPTATSPGPNSQVSHPAPTSQSQDSSAQPSPGQPLETQYRTALTTLATLQIKGRAPKTGYSRAAFYKTWPLINGCNLRQRILKRELGTSATLAPDACTVTSGSFTDPYTGEQKTFHSKSDISKLLQIDHIVALSDAWQKGAQNLTQDQRFALATDPLNLLAADASANMQKSDSDAASWLPQNSAFICQYLSRQISVKAKYSLWVTPAEHSTMHTHLTSCLPQ